MFSISFRLRKLLHFFSGGVRSSWTRRFLDCYHQEGLHAFAPCC